MSDRKKQIERMLRDNGFKLERMNGHYVYVSPRFAEPIVMACTPSDHRASENLYHELKRVTSGVRADASGRRMPSLMTQVAAAQKIKALPKARKGAASSGCGFKYVVKYVEYVADSPERRAQRAAEMASNEAASAREVAYRTARRDERRFVDGCVEFCCTRIDAILGKEIARLQYTVRNFDELGRLDRRINKYILELLKEYATVDDIPDEIWDPYTHSLPWPEKDEKSGVLSLNDLNRVVEQGMPTSLDDLLGIIRADIADKKSTRAYARQKVRNIAQCWLDAAKDGVPCFSEEAETENEGQIIFQGIIREWHASMAIVKREAAQK
jgi:hypothetical protein